MSLPTHLRIFLSSPGDVGDERALATKTIDDLQYDPLVRGKVTFETIAWDKPGSDIPLLATIPPQEAVNQGLLIPAECHIVIVIFWSRMGTPLPHTKYQKPNGEQFLSGTEWEYLNALSAASENDGLPFVVVYRRMEDPQIVQTDPDYDQKIVQYDRVQKFFADFHNSDGSAERGYNQYNTPNDFREKLENHLKVLMNQIFEKHIIENKPATQVELWQGSPFPGLRSFTPKDNPIYFGRDQDVDALILKLKRHNMVVVFGASGSGKSSLVSAGLIPRLANNAIAGSKDWLLPNVIEQDEQLQWTGLRFNPSDNETPFLSVAHQLKTMITTDERTVETLADDLQQDPTLLGSLLLQQLQNKPDWVTILIFVDQFEELFTLVDKSYWSLFTDMIISAIETKRVRIIFTIRADFFDRLMNLPQLLPYFQDSTYPIGVLSSLAYYDIIRKPAERAGLTFEDGLIERILDDVGQQSGALPLLAYALDELYQARDADGTITFDSYERIGRIKGAIAHRAEAVYQNLGKATQHELPALFRKLSDVDNEGLITRRTALETDLTHSTQLELAQTLVDARLLYVDHDKKKRRIFQVAHEAVFTNWRRLTSILHEEVRFFHWRHRIEIDSDMWHTDQDASLLYLGNKLKQANKFVNAYFDDITSEQHQFIQASKRLYWRNRLIRWAILAIPILISVITVLGIVNDLRLQQRAISIGTVAHFPAAKIMLGPEDQPTFVGAFLIDRYEVSYEQYRLCVQAGSCIPPHEPPRTLSEDTANQPRFVDASDDLPITYTTAYNAQNYCSWVGGRLPTMQEWERAVRGIENIELEDWVRDVIGDAARFNIGRASSIESVGYELDDANQHPIIPNGLVHMIGNASEWTASYCQGDSYNQCSGVWDGQSLPEAKLRVMGFSHNDSIGLIEEPKRLLTIINTADPVPATSLSKQFGFRCAVSVNS